MQYYDYSFGNLEMFLANAEWSSRMQEEAMGMAQTPAPSEPATKTGWVTLAVVTSLFFISLGTLTVGSIKVAEGMSNLYQPLASMQVGGR